MKAIETRYNGYRFRSRTEARWAVLFDFLGLNYEFEPQGSILSNGVCYLPDFSLGIGVFHDSFWVEVKGSRITLPELQNFWHLCKETNKSGWVLIGQPKMKDALYISPEGDMITASFLNLPKNVLERSVATAKQARFEYGETPKVTNGEVAKDVWGIDILENLPLPAA